MKYKIPSYTKLGKYTGSSCNVSPNLERKYSLENLIIDQALLKQNLLA